MDPGPTDIRDPMAGALRVAQVAVAHVDGEAAGRIEEIRRKSARRLFDVGVLGEHKRGKSTFINALLGTAVLPAGVVPVTSVVTEIAHAARIGLSVALPDGRLDTPDVSRIHEFVTEHENPSNVRGVRRLVVGVPAPFLRDGISLYDTPGVGSVHNANTEATLKLLPRLDAAFFLTSADPPISAAERAFLLDVAGYADKLFFVVSKLDLVPEADRDAVLAFTQRVVSEAVGRDVAVFGVSARTALTAPGADPGMRRLEAEFRRFCHEELEAATMRSAARKTSMEVRRALDLVRVRTESLHLSQDGREARRRELAAIAADAERERDTLVVLLRRDLNEVVAGIERDVAAFRRTETERLLREAETIAESWRELRVEPATLDRRLKEVLRVDVQLWLDAEQAQVAALVQEATERFRMGASREAARAVGASAEVMRIDLAVPPAFEELEHVRDFTFSFFEAPTILESLVPDLRSRLPGRSAATAALRAARARIPALVDKHCGRLRHHLTEQLAETERVLARALSDYLARFATSVAGALDRAIEVDAGADVDDGRRLAALQDHERRLAEVLERLGEGAHAAAGEAR